MIQNSDRNTTQFGSWRFEEPESAKQTRKDRLVRYLSRPAVLEESGPPRILRQLMLIISLLVLLALVWASITNIREIAITRGQVVPAGSLHFVEHLEGGIVKEILVDDGEIVGKGQPLLRLESADALAELDRLRAREASLGLRAERLRSFVRGRAPDFSFADRYPTLVADQMEILELQEEAKRSQEQVLLSRIDQRRIALKGLDEQKRNVEEQINLTIQQLTMRRNLVEKGLDSRVNLLESERTLTEIRGNLSGIIGEISRENEALQEARRSLIELEATLRNEALNEMGEITSELAEVRESLRRVEDRVARLDVRAPVSGVVNGLVTRTAGSVIAPGELLMEIVPLDESLVAEVQILPRDVGHIVLGQSARVKVTSYYAARFGTLDGEV
ncbi:MAG: HlyD family type I secretion periplasmic adaptor subunit, partial [Kiloniellales bacterium]|nr:HlyD family type I secretion periplasmic adaptor subunit [Kiloniellales bacterium]